MCTSNSLAAVAMAALLVLAGCAGPVGNTDAPGAAPSDVATPDGGAADEGGTVEFYVSDEENAIDDFAHLNVTVTKIGIHRAGADGDDGEDDDSEGDDDDSETTETPESAGSTGTDANATATSNSTVTATSSSGSTVTATPTPGETEEESGEKDDREAGWVEYEVNRTVDLTELQGANATKLGALAAPEGEYDKVFVHVDGIEATLENGEQVNVKLPSEKLQIKKGFTLGNGRNVSFVFDISVHRAGNSGKYILEPVISESGTSDEVEIEDVDEREGDEGDDDEREEEADDGSDEDEREDGDNATAADLTAEFQGPVRPGEEATVKVTGARGPVAGATVEVDDGPTLETGESGTVTFAVPESSGEIEIEVTKGDAEAELEREFERESENPSLPTRI